MSIQERRDKYFNRFSASESECTRGCSGDSLLPSGIFRINDEAIGAKRLVEPRDSSLEIKVKPGKKVLVAAFDFDGTCISGSSPKKLVSSLSKRNLLTPYKIFRIGLWGLAYKMNWPSDTEGVRMRVFSAFRGFSAIRVNDFLCKFYKRKIDEFYRPAADAEMIAHIEAGHSVILVSASFEPIIASAMTCHPIPIALASRMKIDGAGNYTNEIEGLPTEGPDKIIVLSNFLDEYYGAGNWELGWAYGDHYSDLAMLEAASHPCAVTPDGKLRKYAESHGWDILDWE